MLRGRRRFQGLIYEEPKRTEGLRRGRNEAFIKNRNECLLYRYYYYSKIKRLRYEDVLQVLSDEFFIAARTMMNIFEENPELLKTIFKEKLSIKQLEKKFNYLNWKIIKIL